jgi:beta-lactamase class D OXA-50
MPQTLSTFRGDRRPCKNGADFGVRMLPRSRAAFVVVFAEEPMAGRWCAACLMAGTFGASAGQWEDSAAVTELFSGAGVQGTFVLYDPLENRLVGHDGARARERYVPASTFKLVNALIGLAGGYVRGLEEVLPYGGEPQPFKVWERDMNLREAFPASNVPVFQGLARRIGLETMQREVVRLQYGNAEIGQVVDRFWLDGPLMISAVEQAHFLTRLAVGELPFPPSAQQAVHEIACIERGEGWTLFPARLAWDGGWAGFGRRSGYMRSRSTWTCIRSTTLRGASNSAAPA